MAKKCHSVQSGLFLAFLTFGGCYLFGQEAPADGSRVQAQVISIGILEFHNESEANVVQLEARVTQQLRQKILVASQDLLPKILGADAGAAARPGMTVQEATDLGKQFGVKLIVRGGILPITVDTANGETKAIARLYADLIWTESGTVNTVRVEGSDVQPGSFPDLAGSDAGSPEFMKTPVGQALTRAIERLSEVIRENALARTAAAPVQETPPTEPVQPTETPVADDTAAVPLDATVQAADEDMELQQLVADAQATIDAGAAADPQMLNRVVQGLGDLQSSLAVKADLLQKGETTEQVEQDIGQRKTELRAAIDAVMQSQAVAQSAGYPEAGGSGQAGNMLAQANNYAAEATGLIQKIKDIRAMLWGANEEVQVANQDQYGPVTDQTETGQSSEQAVEDVTGVVLDDGQPVEGAEITDSESGATTTTGPDGGYTLKIPPGILSKIMVKHRGLVLATNPLQVVKGGHNVSDFVLRKSGAGGSSGVISSTSVGRAAKGTGGILKGSVLSGDGKPAAQALVLLAGVGTARSNSKGEFTFVNVPAGTHKLTVEQPGIEPQTAQVRISAKATSSATVRLAGARVVRPVATTPLISAGSGSALSGRVKDNQDKAVIGARVTAIRAGSSLVAVTGRDGRYELKDLGPGAYKIHVSKPGFQAAATDVTLRAGKKEKRDFEMKTVSPVLGQLRAIEQSKLGGLRGKIRGADNRTLAAATVEALPVGQQLRSARTQTNADGEFKLSLREGRYNIRVTQTSFRTETRSVSIRAGKSEEENFKLARLTLVTPGVVQTAAGTRTLGTGQAAQAGAATRSGVSLGRPAATSSGQILAHAADSKTGKAVSGARIYVQGRAVGQTDRSGSYTIESLSPGDYRIGIQQEGYISQEKVIDVRAGGSSRVDFQLASVPALTSRSTVRTVPPLATPATSPGQLEGRVTDSRTGKPISGASVSVSGVGSTATDASGIYRIWNLKANSYQISASRNGYQSQQRTVRVDSGRTARVDFSLTPTLAAPRVMIPRK